MKTYSSRYLAARMMGVLVTLFVLTITTRAQNGTWTNLLGGSWAAAANWNGATPAAGSDNTADFSTLMLGTSPVVTLDGARTIGNMIFGDQGFAYNWTVNTGTGGPLTLGVSSGSPTITVNSGTVSNSVVLAGSAGLIVTGAGNLVLSGANTYTGTTTVNAGNLTLSRNSGGSGTLATTNLTINDEATVTATVANALGYSGTQWVRTFNIYGGTYNNTSTGDGCWEATFNLMGGTVSSASGDLAVDNTCIFNTIATNITSTISSKINTRSTSGLIPFNVSAGTASPDLLVSGNFAIGSGGTGVGIVKTGLGVMSLTGADVYTGGTIVSNGVLQLSGNGGSAGELSASAITVKPGAELDLNTSDALGYANTQLLTVNGTVNKIYAQSETLFRPTVMTNGTITSINGASANNNEAYNWFGGYIRTIAGTTNLLTGSYNFGLRTSSCYFTNEANSTLTIACVVQGYQNAGTTPFNKMGPGKLILTAANTYAGSTAINGGTLEVDGSIGSGAVTIFSGATLAGTGTVNGATTIAAGGTLMVGNNGSLATLSISNALTISSGGTNLMRINKTGATLTSDLLQGMTSVSFGGTLTVTATGAAPIAGDTFKLFNSLAYGGSSFDNYNLPALAGGLTWDKSQLLVNGTISVTAGIPATATPAFNPPAGNYAGAQSVTINSDVGSTIFYTTDGSDPTTSGTRISGVSPVAGVIIPINTSETLKAYATNAGTSDSVVASATYTTVPSGIWTNTAGGTWAVAANWTNGAVPNGSGVTADFSTLTLPANTIVSLNSAKTIGTMVFADQGNTYGWTLNGSGSLTVDAGAAIPSIVVSNQNVNLAVPIAGTNGLIVSGAGADTTGLTLSSASSSFTGNLTLSGISATNTTAAGTTTSDLGAKVSGRNIVINSNAVLTFTLNNIFGGSGMTNTSLPTLVINGTMFSTRYNALPNIVLNGGILDQNASDGGNYQGYQFIGNVTVGGSAASTISTQDGKTDDLLGSGTTFNVAVTGAVGPDLTVSAPLANASSDYGASVAGLVKIGAGTMSLTSANTYTGPTIVSNGTLQVSVIGSIATGAVMVNGGTFEMDGSTGNGAVTVNGGTLDGTGYIYGPVTVNGGTLSADTAAEMGTLYVLNNLSLSAGGTVAMRINKTGTSLSSDNLSGMTSMTYGGTLTVTATGDALAAGDTFVLFSSGTYGGVFLTNNLPPLPSGLFWDTSGLVANGSIAVTANAPTPVFNPYKAGGYGAVGTLAVTITSESGAVIYYTTDGSDPAFSGTVMSHVSPATVVIPANIPNETIIAYASVPAGNSGDAYATYSTVDQPTWISPYDGSWSGTYNWSNNVVANGVDLSADFSTLTLTADTTVTLDTPITVGNLLFADQGNAFNWILADGGAGPLTLAVSNGSPVITVNNQNVTNNTVFAGSQGMIKAGAGTLALTAVNTYTGNTIVNAGNLILGIGGGSGTLSSSNLTVNPGAVVTTTAVNASGYSGSAWVTTLNLYGGTFTNTASGDEGWQLTVNLMGGTMASGPGHFAMGGPVGGPGTIINTIATNVPSVISGTINTRENNPSNQIPFNVAAGTASPDLLVNAVINNNLAGVGITKIGAGILSLTAADTFNGPMIVSNGVLQLSGNGGTLGTLQNSAVTVYGSAELQLFTGDALGSTYSTARTLALMGGILREISTNSETLSRPTIISNSTITANSGAGNINTGYVGDCYNLFNSTAIISTGANSTNYISLPAGCQFALRGGSFSNALSSTLIVNGVIDGYGGSSSFALIKDGPGGMILNSNNTYTGSTVVTNGLLEVDGTSGSGAVTIFSGATLAGTGTVNGATTIAAGGTLMAGNNGPLATLSISNALTINSGGTNLMRINKTGATLTSDLLQGMTSVTFGGTLTVTATGAALIAGDTFKLFNSLAYSGIFASYNLPALAGGLTWDKSQLLVNGTISVTAGIPATATPAFNPPAGNYAGAQSVTINSDVGSTIFYTTDGSDPTTSGTRISGVSPVAGVIIPINTSETLKAYATNAGTSDSVVASATYTTVPSGIWTNTAGGTWAVAANWTNGAVPNGSGVTADFSTLTLPANTIVSLNSAKTIGTMVFADQGNTYGWTLNGSGSLTVDAGAAIPSIVVSNQNVNLAVPIAGTNGWVKSGPGNLNLMVENDYSGSAIVSNGVLQLSGSGGSIGTLPNSAVTIESGAELKLFAGDALGYTYATNRTLTLNGGTMREISTNSETLGRPITMFNGIITAISGAGNTTAGYVGDCYNLFNATAIITTYSNSTNYISLPAGCQFALRGGSFSNALASVLIVNGVLDGWGGSGSYSLNKDGTGSMILNSNNTYTGSTIVNNGFLEVEGSISNGGVTVNGGTLDGNGSIAGGVTVNTGGTLSAGTASGIGTLTISNSLFMSGGTLAMRLNKTGGVLTNDTIQGLTSVTYYSGTLKVTATGDPLAAGDKFTLFVSSAYNSAFSATNLPALTGGLAWDTSSLAVDGSIKVIGGSVNTTPPEVTNIVSGGSLTLSWPADHIGWRLLVQTNHLAQGISVNTNDWMTVTGSTTTNQISVPIDATKVTEFYRLVYP